MTTDTNQQRRLWIVALLASTLFVIPCAFFALDSWKAHMAASPFDNAEDELLVKTLAQAVQRRVEPEVVDSLLPQQPTVSTLRPGDENAFQRIDIGPDPAFGKPLPPLEGAKAVMYWVRPVKAHDTKVCGIVWTEDGKSELFFGIVYPP
jgi:hypothetical protein